MLIKLPIKVNLNYQKSSVAYVSKQSGNFRSLCLWKIRREGQGEECADIVHIIYTKA